MEKDIALLMETELFRDLTPEEICNVLKIARHVEFEAEDIIMSEGDFGDTLYVILEGTVEVVKSLTMIEESKKTRSSPGSMPPSMLFSEKLLFWRI